MRVLRRIYDVLWCIAMLPVWAVLAAVLALNSCANADDTIRIQRRNEWPWARVEINNVEQFGMGGGFDPGSYGVAGAWIELGSGYAGFFDPSHQVGCVATRGAPFGQFNGRHCCIDMSDDECVVVVTEAGCGLDVQRLYEFLGAWFAGHMPQADFNHDEVLGVQDVFDYLKEAFR